MIFGHNVQLEQPTAGCAYVARIEFLYGDRTYKPGDDFDWKALGLTESQASDLWVAGRLFVKPRAPERKRKG